MPPIYSTRFFIKLGLPQTPTHAGHGEGLPVARCCSSFSPPTSPLQPLRIGRSSSSAHETTQIINRHQADACHAYHSLRNRGTPSSRIITFVFNDAVNCSLNPFPGKLFNAPGPSPPDVYAGCVMDYTGEDVTVANIEAVLLGNASAVTGGSGRVLASIASDNVLINFIDHGAPYLVQIPTGPYWYSWQIQTVLVEMYQRGMFKQLAFYLESCQSGTIFQNLTKTLPVFATTASSGNESSYAIDCPPTGDFVNGTELETCLGDMYEVSVLDNIDSPLFANETLEQQFQRVRARNNLSTVEQYGDASVGRSLVSDFVGSSTPAPPFNSDAEVQHHVRTYDVAVAIHQHRYHMVSTVERLQVLEHELAVRNATLQRFESLRRRLVSAGGLTETGRQLTQRDCNVTAINTYESRFGRLPDFALQFLGVFVNMCEKWQGNTDVVADSIGWL